MSVFAQKVDAVVLRAVDYGESDRIIGLFTKELGKITAYAPGARKSIRRFGGGLDLFARVTAEVTPPRSSDSRLWRLLRITPLEMHVELRKDLRALAVASYLSECLWSLEGEENPQEAVFSWWLATLGELSSDEKELELSPGRDLELLSLLGYRPQWKVCSRCGKPPAGNPLFFSFPKGGVVCLRCRGSEEGRTVQTKVVARLASGEPIPVSERKEFQRAVDAFVNYTLGRVPKSQGFRREVFRETG